MNESFAIYRDLALAFFKIGLFGFGGGYAMLPLVRHEMVDVHGWSNAQGFTDLVAISQMTPGPIIANAATYCGYTAAHDATASMGFGVLGSLLATVAVSAAPFFLMWLVCRYFNRIRQHPRVRGALKALRPVVVGMVAAAALSLIEPGDLTTRTGMIGWAAVFASALFLTLKWRWHPILVLSLAGVAGFLFF